MRRLLAMPDLHAPYHDKRAFNTFLRAGRAFKPDILVTLGDTFDFYAVSRHSKDPSRTALLAKELEAAGDRLDALESLNAKERIFVMGNHEDRLERYLQDKAPELFGLVSVDKILELSARGWKVVPYKSDTRIGRLYVTHDVGHSGKSALSQTMDAYQANVLFGHTHRLGWSVVGNVRGKPHIGVSAGHLSDLRKVDYMHRAKAARDWAHGFVYGYVEDNGNVHLVPCAIVDGKCVVEGKVIK